MESSWEFQNLKDIEKMIIVSRDGTKVYLGDIARVEDGAKKRETIARYNGKNVIGISLNKVSDGNAIDIAKAVYLKLGKIKKLLPEGVSLKNEPYRL